MAAEDQVIETPTSGIPDRWSKIGAHTEFNPRPASRLRMIVEGPPGSGKSTFFASDPSALILDFDKATENVYKRRATAVPISTFAEYAKVKELAEKDAKLGRMEFTRVVFDTADEFMDLIDRHLIESINAKKPDGMKLATIKEFGQSGAGFNRLTSALLRELKDWDQMGYVWSVAAHMTRKIVKIGDQDVQITRCLMPPTTMAALVRNADIGAYISPVVIKGKEVQEVTLGNGTKVSKPVTTAREACKLVIQNDETLPDSKRRLYNLVCEIELPPVDGLAAFAKVYDAAVQELKENTSA
jgi:hypothetical protein